MKSINRQLTKSSSSSWYSCSLLIAHCSLKNMLAKRIIPCLDVDKGRVVKGINFVDLVDAGDPVAQAKFYDGEGADELVFLDISASSDNRATMLDVVRRTAEEVFIPFTIGGGIRTADDMREILRSGADKISVNSAAVKNPLLISDGAERFGVQCIVVAIDESGPGKNGKCLSTAGGLKRSWMPSSGRRKWNRSVRVKFF